MNNRNICKAKRKDTNEWIEGYYVCLNRKRHLIYTGYAEIDSGEYYPDYHEVIPKTVVRCTGLEDKNGNLIFEGYICKHRSNCSDKFVISVVTYTDGHFLALVNEHSGFELSEKLEIIGNIHDNPELLEVKR